MFFFRCFVLVFLFFSQSYGNEFVQFNNSSILKNMNSRELIGLDRSLAEMQRAGINKNLSKIKINDGNQYLFGMSNSFSESIAASVGQGVVEKLSDNIAFAKELDVENLEFDIVSSKKKDGEIFINISSRNKSFDDFISKQGLSPSDIFPEIITVPGFGDWHYNQGQPGVQGTNSGSYFLYAGPIPFNEGWRLGYLFPKCVNTGAHMGPCHENGSVNPNPRMQHDKSGYKFF